MANWRWNQSAGRYIDSTTGKFISRSYVLSMVQNSVIQSSRVLDTLAGFVSAGELSIGDMTVLGKNEIRDEMIRQYLAGIGGRQMMTKSDWGKVGSLIKEQYKYWDRFMRDIPNLSEAQIRFRASMYSEATGRAYEISRAKVATQIFGADTVSWLVDPSLENCDDCIGRQNQGPQPIGPHGGFPTIDGEAFPKDGTTVCMTHCGCALIYTNSKTGEEYAG